MATQELRQLFDNLDVAGKGYLDLQDGCFDPDVFAAMDGDGDGMISFADFRASYSQIQRRIGDERPLSMRSASPPTSPVSPDPHTITGEGEKSELRKTFDALDTRRRGHLSVASIEALWREQKFSRPLSASITQDPMHKVSFEEFVQEFEASAAAQQQTKTPEMQRKVIGRSTLDSPMVSKAQTSQLQRDVSDLTAQLKNISDERDHLNVLLKRKQQEVERSSELADQQVHKADQLLATTRVELQNKAKQDLRLAQEQHKRDLQGFKDQLQQSEARVAALQHQLDTKDNDTAPSTSGELRRLKRENSELLDALNTEQETTSEQQASLAALKDIEARYESLKATHRADQEVYEDLSDKYRDQTRHLQRAKDNADELREELQAIKRRSEIVMGTAGHSLASEINATKPDQNTQVKLVRAEERLARLEAQMEWSKKSFTAQLEEEAERSRLQRTQLELENGRLQSKLEGHEAAGRSADEELKAALDVVSRLRLELAESKASSGDSPATEDLAELIQLNKDLQRACVDLEAYIGKDTLVIVKENQSLKRLYQKLRVERAEDLKELRTAHAQLSLNYAKSKSLVQELEEAAFKQDEQLENLRRQLAQSKIYCEALQEQLISQEQKDAADSIATAQMEVLDGNQSHAQVSARGLNGVSDERLPGTPGNDSATNGHSSGTDIALLREEYAFEMQAMVEKHHTEMQQLTRELAGSQEKLIHCWDTIAEFRRAASTPTQRPAAVQELQALSEEILTARDHILAQDQEIVRLEAEIHRLRQLLTQSAHAQDSPSQYLADLSSIHSASSQASIADRSISSTIQGSMASGSRMQHLLYVNGRKLVALRALNHELSSPGSRVSEPSPRGLSSPLSCAQENKLSSLQALNTSLSRSAAELQRLTQSYSSDGGM